MFSNLFVLVGDLLLKRYQAIRTVPVATSNPIQPCAPDHATDPVWREFMEFKRLQAEFSKLRWDLMRLHAEGWYALDRRDPLRIGQGGSHAEARVFLQRLKSQRCPGAGTCTSDRLPCFQRCAWPWLAIGVASFWWYVASVEADERTAQAAQASQPHGAEVVLRTEQEAAK